MLVDVQEQGCLGIMLGLPEKSYNFEVLVDEKNQVRAISKRTM